MRTMPPRMVAKLAPNPHIRAMTPFRDEDEAKARKETRLARKVAQGEEGREAMADYVNKQAATLTLTATLKAQCLAREAEPKPIAMVPDTRRAVKAKRVLKRKAVS